MALATMACGFTFSIPVSNVNTGPTVTEDISIALPEGDGVVDLSLGFGAGELRVFPGGEEALVQGTATYNVPDFKPEITVSGNDVRIENGSLEIEGIPNFGEQFDNKWDLELAPVPMDLTIEAGAYQGKLELGGLALRSVNVMDGAADVDLRFSDPNQIEMETFRYSTGASAVRLRGLANANFDEMEFKGGAGEYTLDFSGELQRDATVTIDSGVSSVRVIVPEGTSARVFFDGGLANVDVDGEWEKRGSQYTLEGEGPRLTINVNLGAGNLELQSR
jgi:hypothetical protein